MKKKFVTLSLKFEIYPEIWGKNEKKEVKEWVEGELLDMAARGDFPFQLLKVTIQK